jgi:hypothetical protein
MLYDEFHPTVGDKLSQRMNNKELRTLRKKTRTMNKT